MCFYPNTPKRSTVHLPYTVHTVEENVLVFLDKCKAKNAKIAKNVGSVRNYVNTPMQFIFGFSKY